MRQYDPEHCAVFYRTKEMWGELSNMNGRFPFQMGELKVISNEHLYQALRFSGNDALQALVLNAAFAMLSKRVAYEPQNIIHTIPGWKSGLNLRAMKFCLQAKLYVHRHDLSIVFKQANGRPIVEKSMKDQFWGAMPQTDGMLVGDNQLGEMWSDVWSDFVTSEGNINVEHTHELLLFGKPLHEWWPSIGPCVNATQVPVNLSLF